MRAVYMGGQVCLEWHKAPPVDVRERERGVKAVIKLMVNMSEF